MLPSMEASVPVVVGVGIAAFAATNLDDLILVAAFFADPGVRPWAVVIGRFAGIGALVLVSALAGLAGLAVPEGWVALLGLIPLGLGVHRLVGRRRRPRAAPATGAPAEHAVPRSGAPILAVAAVTMANGGDNLAVYIPLFASAPHAIPAWAAVFAVMTALSCGAGYGLVNNPLAGRVAGRCGEALLPLVLIALGVSILAGVLG
jgi:cadmium resistance protein CadD (predicted permease)